MLPGPGRLATGRRRRSPGTAGWAVFHWHLSAAAREAAASGHAARAGAVARPRR